MTSRFLDSVVGSAVRHAMSLRDASPQLNYMTAPMGLKSDGNLSCALDNVLVIPTLQHP